jgi:hypothetical protein
MRVEWVRTAVTASLAVAYGSPPNASALPAPSALCLPPSLVQGAEIVMLDQHGGRGATSNLNLADSRHPTHVVSVEAGSSGKPVVLIVSAYEPTVWDVFSGRLVQASRGGRLRLLSPCSNRERTDHSCAFRRAWQGR